MTRAPISDSTQTAGRGPDSLSDHTASLLICTDLDRTLLPNGPESESSGARQRFADLAARPEVVLAYVTGRHLRSVEKAINHYRLPTPDFVIGDVGTTLHEWRGDAGFQRLELWEQRIGKDWAGHAHDELKGLLSGLPALRLQEHQKQNRFKLSFYLPLQTDRASLAETIQSRLKAHDIAANLIFSNDEPHGVGLLDVLPASASKYHAIRALMELRRFKLDNTVFCGDSGNDLEVLVSEVPSVLVANAQPEVKERACRGAETGALSETGASQNPRRLYLATGDFHGMNGNYSAGILEGIAHFYPQTLAWMGFPPATDASPASPRQRA